MKKTRGFSLIELAIVLVTIGAIASLAWPDVRAWFSMGSGSLHIGALGVTEVRCIDGYKFVIGTAGRTTQMLDQNGGGVPCQ